MPALLTLVVSTVAILIAAYIVPGVKVQGVWTAFVVAVVMGLLNAFVKPILIFLTLPVTFLTLGLFLFVINTLIVLLAARIVPGFSVASFWTALLFSIVASLVGWLLMATV